MPSAPIFSPRPVTAPLFKRIDAARFRETASIMGSYVFRLCDRNGAHSAMGSSRAVLFQRVSFSPGSCEFDHCPALLATPFLPLSQAEPSSRHMTPRYLVKPETLWKVIRQNEDGTEDILAVADTEEEAEETSAYLKEQETDARQQRE